MIRASDDMGGPVRGPLTERQRQVVRLIAQGKKDEAIRSELGMGSVKTVEYHRKMAMVALGAKSTVELVHWALWSGLVENFWAGRQQPEPEPESEADVEEEDLPRRNPKRPDWTRVFVLASKKVALPKIVFVWE